MKVITRTLKHNSYLAREDVQTFTDSGTWHYLPHENWRELGKPDRIVVQVSAPADDEAGS